VPANAIAAANPSSLTTALQAATVAGANYWSVHFYLQGRPSPDATPILSPSLPSPSGLSPFLKGTRQYNPRENFGIKVACR